jgi:hypothetical protein
VPPVAVPVLPDPELAPPLLDVGAGCGLVGWGCGATGALCTVGAGAALTDPVPPPPVLPVTPLVTLLVDGVGAGVLAGPVADAVWATGGEACEGARRCCVLAWLGCVGLA